jgi:hypothetical protein
MKFIFGEFGLARVLCLGICLLCANGFVAAQQIISVSDPGDTDALLLTHPSTAESIVHNVPPELLGMQAQGPGAVNTPHPESDGNFFKRLGHFYAADWTGKLPSSAAPTRRALDAPLESPPFPSSDWGYGGSSPIGVPDGNVYPLMTALNMEDSRTKVYGWAAGSVNASTSSNNNFPLSYDIFPNRVELNQAVVYVERLPNTVQKTHFDWGYHLPAFTASTTDSQRQKDILVSSCCRRTMCMGSIRC